MLNATSFLGRQMSSGYGWEGLRQVFATLLGARHVPERLCGGTVYVGTIFTFTFTFFDTSVTS